MSTKRIKIIVSIIILSSCIGIINVASHYYNFEANKSQRMPTTQALKKEHLTMSIPACNAKRQKIYDADNIKIYSECGSIAIADKNIIESLKNQSTTMDELLETMEVIEESSKMNIYQDQEVRVVACQTKKTSTYYFVGLDKKTNKLCEEE